MARRFYAGRYAQAVFEIALEGKELDRWQFDLRMIAALNEEAALMAFLESPKFPLDDKVKIVSARLSGINPLALNLVYLLVARGRLRMASDISEEYRRRLDRYRGIEPAEVTTAVSLGEEEKRRLAEDIGTLISKKMVLKSAVDSGIVGGLIVRVGGKLLDGSTHGKLEALKKQLVGLER
jgi:F-type H+-transporting ATPase subunit delta